jgi:hypothetical protein
LRKTEGAIERAALNWHPQGARRRGLPRKTWKKTVEEEAAEMGKTWKDVKRLANNRTHGDVSQMPYAPVRSDRELAVVFPTRPICNFHNNHYHITRIDLTHSLPLRCGKEVFIQRHGNSNNNLKYFLPISSICNFPHLPLVPSLLYKYSP